MLKNKFLHILLCTVLLSLIGCSTDMNNAGEALLDEHDAILVKADTFALNSKLRYSPGVISTPDSLLVGELETRFGTVRASFLTQLSCPEGFRYPENAVFDSACLFVYYRSWTGDNQSPLAINVYQMDLNTLEYSPEAPYLTRIDPKTYCSMSDETAILRSQRIVVTNHPTDSVYHASSGAYLPVVRFRLSDEFLENFTSKRIYRTQDDFNQFFKGLYVTSDFGSSTILNLLDVSLLVYYHFSYERFDLGVDTVVTDAKGFYANSEVRQVNLFEYLNDKGNWLNELENSDTCYVIAPAGVYTTISLPMGLMDRTIKDTLGSQKRPYVNLAQLRVDVIENEAGTASWMRPSPSMLLMKDNDEGTVERFFEERQLPNDTSAILSNLRSNVDSLGNTHYYYSFDISTLLTRQLRLMNNPDTLQMTIVPVSVTEATSSYTTITGVRQSQTMSATMLRSANNSETPMTLKVVYSGF